MADPQGLRGPRARDRFCGPLWLADGDGPTVTGERGPFDHRGPRVALGLFVGTVAVVGTLAAGQRQPEARPLDVLGLVLLLVAPVVLVTLVQRPAAAAAVAIGALFLFLALGYPWGPVFVPVVAVLVGILLSGPAARGRVVAWAGAGAGVVAVVVADALRDQHASPILLFVAAAWSCAALFAAGNARERASRVSLQRWAADERERAAATAERLRIARDLHDVLAHSLSAINVQAGVGLHLLDREPEQARAALSSIRETSGRALDDVREVLGIVRREPSDRRSAALPHEITDGLGGLDELAAPLRVAGVQVELRPASVPVGGRAGEVAYRVVQEALTNAGRHAEGVTWVEVRLAVREGILDVTVTDDGVVTEAAEPTASAPQGFGLLGMRERVLALGGSLVVGPRPGGFAVHARIPLREDMHR
jgi:signal transduction histidine kinase